MASGSTMSGIATRVACRPQGGNVANALLVQLGLSREEEEIDDHTGRVQHDSALD